MSFDGDLYPSAGASKVITSQGDIVRGDASGNRERLGIGSNLQQLQSNGTTLSWQTISAGGAYTSLASVVGDNTSGTITTGTITAMNSITVYVWTESFVNGRIRFNGDTGANYARRYRGNTDTSGTSVNVTGIEFLWDLAPAGIAINIMNNTAGEEKTLTALSSELNNTNGAGTGPNAMNVSGKWANTADRITEVSFFKSSNWLSTERIIVVGID